MGIIICPSCKKEFDIDVGTCPFCGYPYEFMVKRQAIDHKVYSIKFFKAIEEHDRYTAIKCLGVFEYLNLTDLDGLYAIVNMEDGKFDIATKQLMKCLTKSENPFRLLWLRNLFKCYALQGKLVEVQKLIQENKDILCDYWDINYWAILATKNVGVEQYKDYLIAKANGDINDDTSFLKHGSTNNTESKNKIKDLLAETFVELIVLLRGLVRAHEISKGTSEISLEENYRPGIFKSVLSYSSMLFGEDYELIPIVDEIYHLSRYVDIGTDEYNNVCNKAAKLIHRLMFDYRDASPKQIVKYILYLIKIDALGKAKRKAIREAKTVLSLLIENKEEAIDVLAELDTHELLDTSNEILYAYKENVLAKSKGYLEHVFEQQVYHKLSPRGIYAFQVAEWAFDKSREEDYSWKDAGPLSLNYFRIIELELNQKMIVPIISGTQYKDLRNVVKKEKSAFSDKQKDIFQKRWGQIVFCLKKINDVKDPTDGLELGALEFLVKNIVKVPYSEYQVGDDTAKYLFDKVVQLMTEKGVEALINGELLDVISADKRQKYRNPPAHTRYLSFSTAYECRNYVINSLHKIASWFTS